MPIYAVVNADNVVFNRIVADNLDIAQEATGFTCISCDGTSSIGDTWDGSKFIKPLPTLIEEPAIEEFTIEEPIITE